MIDRDIQNSVEICIYPIYGYSSSSKSKTSPISRHSVLLMVSHIWCFPEQHALSMPNCRLSLIFVAITRSFGANFDTLLPMTVNNFVFCCYTCKRITNIINIKPFNRFRPLSVYTVNRSLILPLISHKCRPKFMYLPFTFLNPFVGNFGNT